MNATNEEIVTGLLASAKLTISPEEKAVFVKDYPLIRAAADNLYLPELEFVEPPMKFDPADFYPAV